MSDRAKECPDCSCPVAEVLGELRAAEERSAAAASRRTLDKEVDCPVCEARGWKEVPGDEFTWCIVCEHNGRVALCAASDGFYAVARYAVDRFLAGELHPESSGVVFRLGKVEPTVHRFPQAGKRFPVDPGDPNIPWDAS